jgi:hypothetical protein
MNVPRQDLWKHVEVSLLPFNQPALAFERLELLQEWIRNDGFVEPRHQVIVHWARIVGLPLRNSDNAFTMRCEAKSGRFALAARSSGHVDHSFITPSSCSPVDCKNPAGPSVTDTSSRFGQFGS